eukprot:RCo002314
MSTSLEKEVEDLRLKLEEKDREAQKYRRQLEEKDRQLQEYRRQSSGTFYVDGQDLWKSEEQQLHGDDGRSLFRTPGQANQIADYKETLTHCLKPDTSVALFWGEGVKS